VIQNLVLNAQQAMPDGGVVRIEAENLIVERGNGEPSDAGRWVRFRVIDEGVGIAAADLSKIFDPYFTTKREGKGLGLATSYAIVDKHGGRVDVTSEPGRGSTVTVDLPAADGAPPEPVAAERETPADRGRGRVLVMDDEPPVREVAERMLEHLGYRVALTAEGREAVELYRREMNGSSPFDLVIVDLTVPGGMGGAEAVRRLRELDPSVRAVVCSGYSNDPVMARYREHGFVGVIHKPFDLRRLARVLAEAAE
jgi:CheY-like chemotaxis protein